MERNHLFFGLVISCLYFSSCGKDADGFFLDTEMKEITVTTHANGYMPEGAAAGTRASTSGNTFKFTTGDEIGLIAVKNGSVVSQYNNVKLAYSGSGRWRGVNIYDCGATSYISVPPDVPSPRMFFIRRSPSIRIFKSAFVQPFAQFVH